MCVVSVDREGEGMGGWGGEGNDDCEVEQARGVDWERRGEDYGVEQARGGGVGDEDHGMKGHFSTPQTPFLHDRTDSQG